MQQHQVIDDAVVVTRDDSPQDERLHGNGEILAGVAGALLLVVLAWLALTMTGVLAA